MRRLRTPEILQMEAADCGAAALAMVLAFHGRHVALEDLRAACGSARDGSCASAVAQAARGYGLDAHGELLDLAALRSLRAPCILFWEGRHFVVLERLARRHAWINDPACGRRRVSIDAFLQAYSGLALCFKPGPDFRRGGRPPALWRILLRGQGGSLRAQGFLLACGLLSLLPMLLLPLLVQLFIDEALVASTPGWRASLPGIAAAAGLAALILAWLMRHACARLAIGAETLAAARCAWQLLRMPAGFMAARPAGMAAQGVQAAAHAGGALAGQPALLAAPLAGVFLFALLQAASHPLLGPACLVLTMLGFLFHAAAARRQAEGAPRLRQLRGQHGALTAQGLDSLETLQAGGSTQEFFTQWCDSHAALANAGQILQQRMLALQLAAALMPGAAVVLRMGWGGWLVAQGSLSLGGLVAMTGWLAGLDMSLRALLTECARLDEMRGALAHQHDVLAQAPRAAAKPDIAAPPQGMEARGLSFSYSRRAMPAVDGISLRLEAGQCLAVLGASGSGKSTLLRLLSGRMAAQSGELLMDGQAVAGGQPGWLAWVDESVTIFDGSLRDNISLWQPTLAPAELQRAAEDACLHALAAARPGGYDAPAGWRGRHFSSGEIQRIGIARALARMPRFLLLDDATTALDDATEAAVLARLRVRGCGCLLATRRPSTARRADCILVMAQGRIVQRGTHAELAAQDGAYRRLLEAEAA